MTPAAQATERLFSASNSLTDEEGKTPAFEQSAIGVQPLELTL
jgi:hypothetical protein